MSNRLTIFFKYFEQLEPVSQLNEAYRQQLYKLATEEELFPRVMIPVNQEKPYYQYVLEGEVVCLSKGKPVELVKSGTDRSKLPLVNAERGIDKLLTPGGARVVQFEAVVFDNVLEKQHELERTQGPQDGAPVKPEQLFSLLSEQASKGTLEMPNFPDAALKVRAAIEDPEVGLMDVSQIVQADPVLAAHLIQVANSPLYRGWEDVKTVRDAVGRLGMEATRTIAFSLAANQLFTARSAVIKERIQSLYRHSTYVSAIAFVVAKQVPNVDPEEAMLAGLLHDIGAIPVLQYADRHPTQVPDVELLDYTLARLRTPIGGMLLKTWGFDESMVELVSMGDNFTYDHEGEASLSDVVIAARWLSYVGTQASSKVPHVRNVPSIQKLDLNLESEPACASFLKEASDEIAVINQLLKG